VDSSLSKKTKEETPPTQQLETRINIITMGRQRFATLLMAVVMILTRNSFQLLLYSYIQQYP
jgi:hypothetical protein